MFCPVVYSVVREESRLKHALKCFSQSRCFGFMWGKTGLSTICQILYSEAMWELEHADRLRIKNIGCK